MTTMGVSSARTIAGAANEEAKPVTITVRREIMMFSGYSLCLMRPDTACDLARVSVALRSRRLALLKLRYRA
jgi:hypothetical protein